MKREERRTKIAGQKAQVFVTTLWIFLILVFLALIVGHQVSLGLKLSSYYRDALKARLLGRAAVRLAIFDLLGDGTPDYDFLQESWADNEELFKEIRLTAREDGYAQVAYLVEDEGGPVVIYGARDEEGKININTASEEVLEGLMRECGLREPAQVARHLLVWRGDKADTDKVYEGLGYPCKGQKLQNIEELVLVKGIEARDVEKLKELSTVYGSGAVNINTASFKTLLVLAGGLARQHSLNSEIAQGMVMKIIDSRERSGYFNHKDDIDISLVGDDELNLFNELMNNVDFTSDHFSIEALGRVKKINKRISAVYNRKERKIVSWHES